MTRTEEATLTRVLSRDGTEIADWVSGDGPPLVLVHGASADHTRWQPILPYLEPYRTVHAIDRRGRGSSGDAPHYDVEREYDDVAAVVEAVADAGGSAVDVLGHSFGGVVAFGAATRTSKIRRLVLYEGWPAPSPELMGIPPGVGERMDALIAAGQREAALEVFFREAVGMPDHEFATYRLLPAWQARIAAAHTIAREGGAIPTFDPAQAALITVPVLMLVGGDSPASGTNGYETVAAALPDARVSILDGQQHIAMDLVPDVFSHAMLTFLRDGEKS